MAQGWRPATAAKTTGAIDWQICASDAEWEAVRQAAPVLNHPGSGPRLLRWSRQEWAGVGVLVMGVLLAVVWLVHTAQTGLATVESEIGIAVQGAMWVETQGRHAPEVAVDLVDLTSEVAVVQVATQSEATGAVTRQTRVYRRSELGWVRTTPTAAHWGSPQRLETEHFIFHYHARDGKAVKAVAGKLDALYPSLYAAYFPEPPSGPKVVVEVSPEQTPGQIALHSQPEAPFVVASPATYLAPETVSDVDLLAQAVVLALADDLVMQSLSRLGGADVYSQEEGRYYRWSPLVQGVRLWQLWAQDLPLADWREPVVRWALGPLRSDLQAVEPAFLQELCAGHSLWLPTPYAIQIPVWCTTPRLEAELFQESRTRHPMLPSQLLRLAPLILNPDFLVEGTQEMTKSGAPPHPAAVVALATVAEYAAAAYGPETIPVLLAGLSKHTSWDGLVPAVFTVSAAEFEAGWHAHLATKYGIEPDLVNGKVAK